MDISNVPLDRTMVIFQAKIFHEEMETITQSNYSSVWHNKLKNWHWLCLIKTLTQKSSVDIESAEVYVEKKFEEILPEGNFTTEQFYNTDKSSLFWHYILGKLTFSVTRKQHWIIKI